ncbi:MAG: peptidylprolyl isomerase [Planctomycetales bacterium]|nr:peptidylprolyl isomerase [bacterium]UNM07073.1 MAG: peptidylprolyl isomerase [Planctomycetales bacterium]
MNRTILFALVSVMFLSLLAGCPRTDSNAGASNGSTSTSSTNASNNGNGGAQENPCAGQENPCAAEENPCTAGENPCGENPCGENPCGENPCAVDNAATDNPCGENPCGETEPEDKVTTVVLETTDGDIVLEVHSAWSPLGSEHFLELVKAGFYDGAPWFRVLDGFVAQCGVAADPEMNTKWSNKTIQDEPVVVGNKRGFVAFGKSQMPNSRSTHIFINFTDNSSALNPQGFACFAQVVEGMEIADGLFKCEFRDQGALQNVGGLDAFKARFPDADFIKRAYIRE